MFDDVKSNSLITNGRYLKLLNNQSSYVIIAGIKSVYRIFMLALHEKLALFMDEFIKLGSIQTKEINDLYKQFSIQMSSNEFMDKLKKLNNSLVKTRRELQKRTFELEKINNKLMRMNHTDDLTGIGNRRAFFKDFKAYLDNHDIYYIMLDFNNFKEINDKYGHLVGDKLLKDFSSKFEREIKNKSGSAYRLGGDEFAAVIPYSNPHNIENIMERLNQEIKKYHSRISLAYGYLHVSKTDFNRTKRIEDIMKQVDKMMYEKKRRFHRVHNMPMIRIEG